MKKRAASPKKRPAQDRGDKLLNVVQAAEILELDVRDVIALAHFKEIAVAETSREIYEDDEFEDRPALLFWRTAITAWRRYAHQRAAELLIGCATDDEETQVDRRILDRSLVLRRNPHGLKALKDDLSKFMPRERVEQMCKNLSKIRKRDNRVKRTKRARRSGVTL